jgi:peptidyl-prolyl cis-trans isomerase SurA
MMNKIIALCGVAFLGLNISITAQTKEENTSDNSVILTVGSELVSLADFKYIYSKNNRDSVITSEGLDEYMELFVKFKLKVMEAEALGMDTVEAFKKELAGYRKQLTRPYLVDMELLDELVLEAHNRKQEEIHARHILVSVKPEASPSDTLRAWNRISKLRNRVNAGEDFTTLAKSKGGSDDPSVVDNGGDLGWFTAFQMVYAFEEAAYNTSVGELSEIVRTRFGYHFLEIDGRREARGEIQVAHIMVRVTDASKKAMVQSAKSTIDAVASFLKSGERFESLALKYSDDATTASKGGVLPWFGTGKMVEEFENASFNLENNGDVSEPFLTTYGWHIVKRVGFKPLETFDNDERQLRKKVSRDSRADVTRSSFLNKLKKEYDFKLDKKRVSYLASIATGIDSVFYKGHPIENVKKSELRRVLFSIQENVTTVADFLAYANAQKPRGLIRTPKAILEGMIDSMIEEELLAFEDARLEDKHNEFRMLIEEYHDGILLFELTDELVWSKAVRDTSGLERYHELNNDLFMWQERLELGIYTCEDEGVSKVVKKAVKKGHDLVAVRRELIVERPLALKMEEGLFSMGDNNWADSVFTAISNKTLSLDSKSPRFMTLNSGDNGVILIEVVDMNAPTHKTLDEARGQVIASYQDFLENEWIDGLRLKYPVSIKKDVLYELID